MDYSNDKTVLLDHVQIASNFWNLRLLRDIRWKTKINRQQRQSTNKDKFDKSFEMLELNYAELKKIK